MKRVRSSIIGIAGLLALAAGFQGDLFGRSHGPRGHLMTARPTLIWEVWSTVPGEIVGGKAQVGDRTFPARYDATERRIVVELDGPLDPGQHKVTVWASLKDGEAISKSWDVEISRDALVRLPSASESQIRAMNAVNRFRSNLGLPPVRMDDRFNAASLYHAKYLETNGTTGHFETRGKPGFTGEEPGDRHMAFGWVGNSWEDVEYGSDTEEEAIRNLIDAPYHRLPFIQPGELSFGSGHASQRLATAFSMSTEAATVIYPIDRQQDVPISWSYNERPNPLRLYPEARRPVGYPIVLVYFAKESLKLSVGSASLKDAQGAAVPCFLNTSQNDSELTNAAVLIPKAPLLPDTLYSVRFEANVEGGPAISRAWKFRTQPAVALSRKSGR